MYDLTSFCFAGTKIRINLVFSASIKKKIASRSLVRRNLF